MNKKQDLIQILEKLEPIRDLAPWLKILVEQWNLEENMLDILINAVTWAVHTAKSQKDKKKIQKWLEAMQKIKELEKESEEKDKEEIDKLSMTLENI